MFNAGQGQQAFNDKIETLSDEFAARFDSLPQRDKLVFLEKANLLLDDPNAVVAFNAGTYVQATNSTGQPAAALGSGTGSTVAPLQQVADALNNLGVSPGQLQAVLRIVNNSGDPGHMEVEADGTPTELVNTRTERDTANREKTAAETAKTAAETALAQAQDPTHVGSLAHQLAAVNGGDMVAKADVLTHMVAIETAEGQLSTGLLSSDIDNRPALQTAIASGKAFAS